MSECWHLIHWFIYVLLAIIFTPFAVAQEPGTTHDRIRVITYNVQFLPDPVSDQNERPEPEYRAARIAEAISHFDVIALQETFHHAHRELMLESLRQAWPGKLQILASPTPDGFFTSGGCLFVSKLPISDKHTMVFANYSKPIDYGLRADGFAAKGVLHARVQRSADISKQFVDVFVTHLEARDDNLRPLQYVELAAFVKQFSSANQPALLLGDLNTLGEAEFRRDPQSQYSQLKRQLADARSNREWIDLWPSLHKDALGGTTQQESSDTGKRIDYILLSNPPLPNPQLEPIKVAVELFRDTRVTALSDHNAVTAELEWQ